MSDHLPGLSGDMGAGKPLTRAEFARRERERRALQLWIEGKTYTQIKNALNLRNTDAAREVVRLGEERWAREEGDAIVRHVAAQVSRMYEIIQASREGVVVRDRDGQPVVGKDGEVVREPNWGAVDREMKAWERVSKLLGLDRARDDGPGLEITVIDARAPWEREPETIDGEVVDVPRLPGPSDDAGSLGQGEE